MAKRKPLICSMELFGDAEQIGNGEEGEALLLLNNKSELILTVTETRMLLAIIKLASARKEMIFGTPPRP